MALTASVPRTVKIADKEQQEEIPYLQVEVTASPSKDDVVNPHTWVVNRRIAEFTKLAFEPPVSGGARNADNCSLLACAVVVVRAWFARCIAELCALTPWSVATRVPYGNATE